MPKIQEVVADTAAGGPDMRRPREAEQSDTGEVGNAIASLGSTTQQVGQQIYERDAQAETSELSAQIAQAHATFSKGLDDTLSNSDPNDRTISDRFMQGYDDQMGKISDSIQTPKARAYFDSANAQMRANFQLDSQRGQATLAGHAAVQNQQNATDQYASSLIDNPHSFQTVLGLNEAAIDAMAIPQNKKDEIRANTESQLAQSAVRGWIKIDPQNALNQLSDKDSPWNEYFSGDQKYRMEQEAKQGIRANEMDQRRMQDQAAAALDKQQKSAQEILLRKAADGTLTKEDLFDGPGKVLDPFGSGSKNQFLNLLPNQGDDAKGNPAVLIDTFHRIHLPDGDPRKITDENALNELVGKGLTIPNVIQLRSEISGKKTEEGSEDATMKRQLFDYAKSELVKSSIGMMPDPEGDLHYSIFLKRAMKGFDDGRKAGIPITELLDPEKGKNSLYNLVSPLRRTPEEVWSSIGMYSNPNGSAGGGPATQSPAAKPAIEPKKKGESIPDWRKRTSQ